MAGKGSSFIAKMSGRLPQCAAASRAMSSGKAAWDGPRKSKEYPLHVKTIACLSKEQVLKVLDLAKSMKADPLKYSSVLKQRTLLMLFEKPSLRTRVSFETGMTQLGGHAIHYNIADSPLGKKESIQVMIIFTSKLNFLNRSAFFRIPHGSFLVTWTLSLHESSPVRFDSRAVYLRILISLLNADIGLNYAECSFYWYQIMALFLPQAVDEMAANASIPVVNALDDFAHPCQATSSYLFLSFFSVYVSIAPRLMAKLARRLSSIPILPPNCATTQHPLRAGGSRVLSESAAAGPPLSQCVPCSNGTITKIIAYGAIFIFIIGSNYYFC